MDEKYFLLSPVTDTGLSRAMVYYQLLLTADGLFIFLQEDPSSPRSLTKGINAVMLDLICMGVESLEKAPIIFKNGNMFDGIALDRFGNVHFYSLGARTEHEAIQFYQKRIS